MAVISSDTIMRNLVESAPPDVVHEVLNSTEIKLLMGTLLQLGSATTSKKKKKKKKPSTTTKSIITTTRRSRSTNNNILPLAQRATTTTRRTTRKSKEKIVGASSSKSSPTRTISKKTRSFTSIAATTTNTTPSKSKSKNKTTEVVQRDTPPPPELRVALTNLRPCDFIELKGFHAPPSAVKECMNCVLILLRPTYKAGWKQSLRILHRRDLIERLWNFDVENVTQKTLRRLSRYSSKWSLNDIRKASNACVPILGWVHSVERFHGIERLEPELMEPPPVVSEPTISSKRKKKKRRKRRKNKKNMNSSNGTSREHGTSNGDNSELGDKIMEENVRAAPPSPKRNARGTRSTQRRTREIIKDTVIRGSEADW
jgi:hypothetical protein